MDIVALRDYKDEFIIIENCRLEGLFINENSLNSGMANAYSFIKHNYETVKDFYLVLGYMLKKEDGFYYFYKEEYESEDISQSFLSELLHYIDIYKFLIEIDSHFVAENDYVFNISSFETRLNQDIELKNMSEKMSFITKKSTNREFLESLFKRMKKDGFVEVFNNKEGKYKLMKSFKYIEDTIMGITEYE